MSHDRVVLALFLIKHSEARIGRLWKSPNGKVCHWMVEGTRSMASTKKVYGIGLIAWMSGGRGAHGRGSYSESYRMHSLLALVFSLDAQYLPICDTRPSGPSMAGQGLCRTRRAWIRGGSPAWHQMSGRGPSLKALEHVPYGLRTQENGGLAYTGLSLIANYDTVCNEQCPDMASVTDVPRISDLETT